MQRWHLHGDVGCTEHGGHLEGLQGSWNETQLLVEGPDSRHVVANAAYGRETMGEVGDEQAHSGGIWIDEAEMIMIAELVWETSW